MLLYLSENRLTDASAALLEQAQAGTPLVLIQNAVYLYARLLADYPRLSITLLEDDAIVRGISLEEKASWSSADWASKGALFTPWIKL